MGENINNLKEKLNKFVGQNVLIIQEGFLQSKFLMQKLKYSIEYQILSITNNEETNYIKLNLNQVYKVENDDEKIKFYLDNDLSISINKR